MTKITLHILGIVLGLTSVLHAEPLTVGFEAELSGSNAPNGHGCREGVQTAQAWLLSSGKLGNCALNIFFEDHKGDTKAGISAFQMLQEAKGAQAVIATRSQVVMAVNPLSGASRTPLLATVGHKDFVRNNRFSWRFYMSVQAEAKALAAKMASMEKRKLALITLEDEWTLSLKDAIEKAFIEKGGAVVASPTIALSDVDVVPLISKVRLVRPDAVFINVSIAQAGLLIRKLREVGMGAQLYGNLWTSEKETIENAGKEAIEGLVYVSINSRKPKFVEQYKQLFGNDNPKAIAYMCNAALAAIVQASNGCEKTMTGDEVQKGLQSIKKLKLQDEELLIVDREVEFDIGYRQIVNGEIVEMR